MTGAVHFKHFGAIYDEPLTAQVVGFVLGN
jgi:hypothetical protein